MPVDPRRSSNAMPAVAPPPAPSDPRRSSPALPAATDLNQTAEMIPEAFANVSVKAGGTLPMINTAQGSSPGPTANRERSDPAIGQTAPPKMIYATGSVIAGKYRLERVLGQGGMGAVWVVRNLNLEADFALKLIRRDRATEEAAARLLTEARAAAKLGHPGIVRVFDFGQSEVGDPYLVMELLKGDSFGALITRKKRLEPGVAVQMLLPVASALYAAHSKGIVHRDLKPDNIMLATEDSSRKLVPKVLDFGIARVLRDDIDRHQTMAGEVLGSPDYMSPEQARGQLDIDHRTDIWTFAVLLYESITGKRPFEGHNYNALISSIVSNPPMPIHAYGLADTQLSGIIDRGLSKSPSARWQTMRDMGIALAHWAVEHGINQDISGVSIQTEWLASQSPNLLTLAPAQLPRLSVPGAEPQVAYSTAPVVARDAAEWQGLRSNGRTKWIIAAVILAVFVATFILVNKATSIFSDSPTPATSESAAGTTPSPSATSTGQVEPTTTTPTSATSAPSSQPSARASSASTTTSTVPTTRPTTSTKRKAPPVPTNIKF
jgi:serine/threonine-protein kinase